MQMGGLYRKKGSIIGDLSILVVETPATREAYDGEVFESYHWERLANSYISY